MANLYAEWVAYCFGLAARRGLARHLVEDLLPSADEADWHVKPLAEFEEFMEKAFPGRRGWLQREGVRPDDFSTFWSRPPWVQNFIEKLVDRHLELEVQGQIGLGESKDTAFLMAGVFLPLYTNIPDSPGEAGPRVPWELFDRVEEYWAKLDTHTNTDEFMKAAMENDWRLAANRIRAEIRAGKL